MTQFDWPALLRAGLQGLRLTPEQFWRLTPAELRLMLGPPGGAAPMNRAGLDALMAAWPDGMQGEIEDGTGRVRGSAGSRRDAGGEPRRRGRDGDRI